MFVSRIKKLLLVSAVLASAAGSPARADSYYSSFGLGLPRYYVSQKATGMGGAGIGIADPFALNTMNAAANQTGVATCLGVQFDYEWVQSASTLGEVQTANGNAAGVQFIFPLKNRITFISLLRPLTISRFMLKADLKADTLTYSHIIKGNGGLSAGSLGLQYNLNDRVMVAGLINFNFGTIKEEWQYTFAPSGYVNSDDQYNSHLSGITYDLGVLLKPVQRLGVGLIYKTGRDLKQKTDISASSGFSQTLPEGTIRYPGAFGFGVSLSVAKTVWALDYYQQDWSAYRVNGVSREAFKDYQRIGGGVEYSQSSRPTDRYLQRIAWRLGAYSAQLPYANAAGDAVGEQFITAGVSLPFKRDNGRIDMAVELGLRGERTHFLYEEKILRFSVSVMGRERWFATGRN